MASRSWLMAGASLALLASPALAQSGPISPTDAPPMQQPGASALPAAGPGATHGTASNATANTAVLEEVVVTAQKREQNLQDVPVAVTAISAETLSNRNVGAFSDLTRLAPALTITEGNTSANSSINMRGIGTFAFSIGVEPSVAVVVDDVAILQQAQAFSGLSDIARIELLRGPQGTLFGKNASAGAINVVSQGPTSTLQGAVTASATTDEEYRVEASVSGPITDRVGFRLNGFYGDREGYVRNLTTGHKLNGEKSYGLRARLALQPLDQLKIDLIASRSVSDSNGVARPFRTLPPGAAILGTPVAPLQAGITPGPGNYKVRFDNEPLNKSRQTTVSGRATLDMGFANLVSVTSYQDWNFFFFEDLDLTAGRILGLPTGVVASGPFHTHQFTQELRLVSPDKGRLAYTLGLYYSNGDTSRFFQRGPSGPFLARWQAATGSKTYAAFAQATANLTDSTHLDGGLRFNREKIDVAFQNLVTPATPPANNATCLTTCAGQTADNQVTGKIALRQDLSRGIMGYVSYATGYKGQGYDVSTGFTPFRAANPVKPEHSKAYEVGLKSRLLDDRVQLNVAGFWTDYRGFQAQGGVQLPDGSILPILYNVGKLRTKGVEIELAARPTEGLRLDAAFSYTDAKIRKFPNAQCYTGQTAAQGCIDLDGPGPSTTTGQNLAGSRLANAPKYKFSTGARYDTDLPGLPFKGFVAADYSYQSGVNFDLLQNPLTVQKAYGIVNGSVGIEEARDGAYVLTLFVNNLFDKHYVTSLGIATGGPANLLFQNAPRNSRRYFGARLRYRF